MVRAAAGHLRQVRAGGPGHVSADGRVRRVDVQVGLGPAAQLVLVPRGEVVRNLAVARVKVRVLRGAEEAIIL